MISSENGPENGPDGCWQMLADAGRRASCDDSGGIIGGKVIRELDG
jgi:hypothetical protein